MLREEERWGDWRVGRGGGRGATRVIKGNTLFLAERG